MTALAFPRSGFYTYALIDPRDGKPFYVGKGTGRRYRAHESEWRSGRIVNIEKHRRIAAIRATGLSIQYVCLSHEANEAAAFAAERRYINQFGLASLTNLMSGTQTELQRSAERARDLLKAVIPFDVWMYAKARSPWEIEIYHGVVDALGRIVSEQERADA